MDEIALIGDLLKQAPNMIMLVIAVVYLAKKVAKLEEKIDAMYEKSSDNNRMLKANEEYNSEV
jgi:hypothetical protein